MSEEPVIEKCRWCQVRPGGYANSAWCEPCTEQVLLAQAEEAKRSRQDRQVVGGDTKLRVVDDRWNWWDA